MRRHFLRAGSLPGMPQRARQLFLKVWWKRALPTGIPGMSQECVWCGHMYRGEAERHVLFECQVANRTWELLRGKLADRGVATDEDMRPLLLQGATRWRCSRRGVHAARVWRTIWGCYVWALWKTFWDTVHGRCDRRAATQQVLVYGWETMVGVLSVQDRQEAQGRGDQLYPPSGAGKEFWSSLHITPRASSGGRLTRVDAGGQTLRAAGGDDPT